MVGVAEELNGEGGVLEHSHGGGELLGVESLLGTAGGGHPGGSRRGLTRSCATVPSPGAARGAEHDSLGTVGRRRPGVEREVLGSSASVEMRESLIGIVFTSWLEAWS